MTNPRKPARLSVPFSAEAEKALLGSIIQEPECLFQLDGEIALAGDQFFIPRNKIIFEAITHLSQQGVSVDFISLIEELRNRDRYTEEIRDEYIMDLMNKAPLTENILYHAEIIQNTSILRNIMETCERIRNQAGHQSSFDDISELLEDLDKSVLSLRDHTSSTEGLVPGHQVLQSTIETLEKRMNLEGIPGIASGFHDLDNITGGFQKSDLTILAARPGMGKTALVLNWATSALRQQKKVAIFSLEMSKEQLMERVLSSEGKIDSAKMRRGALKAQHDMSKMLKALQDVNKYVIYLEVDDTPSISLAKLVSRCRRLQKEKNLDFVIVDYLQLMVGSKEVKKQGREREVSEISMGLKALAKELAVPVVAVAQLNRSPDGRPDKRPRISDLRESGSMEQDADLIVFIYRDDYYNPNSEDIGQAEIIIGKNRHGPLKTVKLAYLPNYVSFRNLALFDPLRAGGTSKSPSGASAKGTHPPP